MPSNFDCTFESNFENPLPNREKTTTMTPIEIIRCGAYVDMVKRIICLIGLLCLLITAGCSRSFEVIRDIRELPQDHFHYIRQEAAFRDIISADERVRLQNNYNRFFFAPWHQEKPQFGREEVSGFFNVYLKKIDDGGKKKKAKKAASKRYLSNARLDSYPNKAIYAITIRHLDMRGLPAVRVSYTRKDRKALSNQAFDRLQVSSVPVNTPVFISHLSKDKKWCLAETGFAFGWVMARDLAFVDADFMRAWENGSYAAFIKDRVPVRDARGYHFRASIGSLFPKVGEDEDGLKILVAVLGRKGKASILHARVMKTQATTTPLVLNLHNLASMANEFVDDPYGWGGKDEKRDCSSMVRDLFTPFGIWLPRHSADQASQGGYYIDLSTRSREEKLAAIINQGIPYLTLLWLKGHIMLYVGAPTGEPLVFHNFWSVTTMDTEGRMGKKIVGHTAITTLRPGREFQSPDSSRGDFLEAVQGMTFLLPSSSPNSVVK